MSFKDNDVTKLSAKEYLKIECGPLSVVNALRRGNEDCKHAYELIPGTTDVERSKHIGITYGVTKSEDYKGKRPRFGTDGISAGDLGRLYNEVRAKSGLKPMHSSWMIRGDKESKKAFSARVHALLLKSVKSGNLPIIQIRSEAAQWSPNGEFLWELIQSHFVVISHVPDELNDDGSFVAEYFDEYSEKPKQILLFNDPRGFKASTGINGKMDWKANSVLTIAGGSLPLNTPKEPWCMRSVIYLAHAIYSN